MDPTAAGDQSPGIALLGCGMGQAGIPGQWRGDDSAVGQLHGRVSSLTTTPVARAIRISTMKNSFQLSNKCWWWCYRSLVWLMSLLLKP